MTLDRSKVDISKTSSRHVERGGSAVAAAVATALALSGGAAKAASTPAEVAGLAEDGYSEICPTVDLSGNIVVGDANTYELSILEAGDTVAADIDVDDITDYYLWAPRFDNSTGNLTALGVSHGILEIEPGSSGWTGGGGSISEKYSDDDYDFVGSAAINPNTGALVAYMCDDGSSTAPDICNADGDVIINTSDYDYDPSFDPDYGSNGRLVVSQASSGTAAVLNAGTIYSYPVTSVDATTGAITAVDTATELVSGGRCGTISDGVLYFSAEDSYGDLGIWEMELEERDTTAPSAEEMTLTATTLGEEDLPGSADDTFEVDCNTDAYDMTVYVKADEDATATAILTDVDGKFAGESWELTGTTLSDTEAEFDVSLAPEEVGTKVVSVELTDDAGNTATENGYFAVACDTASGELEEGTAWEFGDGLVVVSDDLGDVSVTATSDSSLEASGSAPDVEDSTASYATMFDIASATLTGEGTSHDGGSVELSITDFEGYTGYVTGATASRGAVPMMPDAYESYRSAMAAPPAPPSTNHYLTGDSSELPAVFACGNGEVYCATPDGTAIGETMELDGNCAFCNYEEESDADTDADADTDTDTDADADTDTDTDADTDTGSVDDTGVTEDDTAAEDDDGPKVDPPEDDEGCSGCSTAEGQLGSFGLVGLVGLAGAARRRTKEDDDSESSVDTEWEMAAK